MGIFLVLVGVFFGVVSFFVFTGATGAPMQLCAGEGAICGAVLFGAGAIVMAVDKMHVTLLQAATKLTK